MKSVKRFGAYTIKKKIGEGGYANVFLASNSTGREVALKVLKDSMKNRSNVMRDFQREACVHQKFDHENLVQCYGMEKEKDQIAIVTEYFPSETLKKFASEKRDLKEILNILTQISGVLSYIHRKGYVHLDLKPGNILINEKIEVKLIDFCLMLKVNSILLFTADPAAGVR